MGLHYKTMAINETQFEELDFLVRELWPLTSMKIVNYQWSINN